VVGRVVAVGLVDDEPVHDLMAAGLRPHVGFSRT
jgi:hypothetical protein